jgi:hypothetical protein
MMMIIPVTKMKKMPNKLKDEYAVLLIFCLHG